MKTVKFIVPFPSEHFDLTMLVVWNKITLSRWIFISAFITGTGTLIGNHQLLTRILLFCTFIINILVVCVSILVSVIIKDGGQSRNA